MLMAMVLISLMMKLERVVVVLLIIPSLSGERTLAAAGVARPLKMPNGIR